MTPWHVRWHASGVTVSCRGVDIRRRGRDVTGTGSTLPHSELASGLRQHRQQRRLAVCQRHQQHATRLQRHLPHRRRRFARPLAVTPSHESFQTRGSKPTSLSINQSIYIPQSHWKVSYALDHRVLQTKFSNYNVWTVRWKEGFLR